MATQTIKMDTVVMATVCFSDKSQTPGYRVIRVTEMTWDTEEKQVVLVRGHMFGGGPQLRGFNGKSVELSRESFARRDCGIEQAGAKAKPFDIAVADMFTAKTVTIMPAPAAKPAARKHTMPKAPARLDATKRPKAADKPAAVPEPAMEIPEVAGWEAPEMDASAVDAWQLPTLEEHTTKPETGVKAEEPRAKNTKK
jgi:hypothetical protein